MGPPAGRPSRRRRYATPRASTARPYCLTSAPAPHGSPPLASLSVPPTFGNAAYTLERSLVVLTLVAFSPVHDPAQTQEAADDRDGRDESVLTKNAESATCYRDATIRCGGD